MPTQALVTVAGKVTASITNTTIANANAEGTTRVVPTSVAGSGVSVGTNGVVAFNAATAASINGCFSATYDWYLLEFDATASGAANISYVFRAAGTDNATNYSIQRQLIINTVANASQLLAGVSSFFATIALAGETSGGAKIYNPFRAVNTTVDSKFGTTANPMGTTSGMTLGYTHHAVASSFDGMTISCSTGTMTGTVRIYGYNNN